ncbi:hypothetical protein OHU11_42005 (plasmid) [Streptomyces sp. NBC_00257]|uniref:hypothetical protein n=1 Tax=unclassified Streptomyces TaxID=2593676 RepID=UPI00224DA37C|nr:MULTISPECIES: hypothetical protein [unclassified Streptomyces]MCX5434755.1 hypothetical protein [Streptomyces sp. NBC_00062]
MANVVWHEKLRIHLDLTRDDLGHEGLPGLWDTIYATDRLYAARSVPVSQRGLQCGGVCQEAGVIAWMHLRLRANGRREAVHEKAEDEARHTAPMSDEHKAYQERILLAATAGGFGGDCEVRTRVGRSWIQTDTLVEGAGGRRIGWEVQLSTAGEHGPRSVRARASKAAKHGIIPAWHTDRADYALRSDTQWTRSNNLPAHVIAKAGDLRVISGFRALDFWHCGVRALYPCPNGARRCGKHHATPKPRDVLFDDLVRKTAAGEIVPVEHRTASKTHRFWVTSTDRDRLEDLRSDDTVLPLLSDKDVPGGASANRPTCRPAAAVTALAPPVAIPSEPLKVTIPRQLSPIPSLPAKPAIAPAPSPTPTPPPSPPTAAKPVRFLDWRASSHWSSEAGPCRHCRKLTHLLDSQAVHAHKVCAEEAGGE